MVKEVKGKSEVIPSQSATKAFSSCDLSLVGFLDLPKQPKNGK